MSWIDHQVDTDADLKRNVEQYFTASAATAEAACAWVLWSEMIYPGAPIEGRWAPVDSAEQLNQCEEMARDRRARMKQFGEFTAASMRFVCLPDTVDPLGPKVK